MTRKYPSDPNGAYLSTVMPAKAGIQLLSLVPNFLESLDSRLRGNDVLRAFWLKEAPLQPDPDYADYAWLRQVGMI
ncbi:MAG: hypothetical protein Q8J93_09155 [Xanthomonadales bacterium]|nr:hypothetical protein [Xanthomonadales bacterium]MDZ4116680.1 hypothetical protein [Xanthomonadaceae bacterium]MDZ4376590.1 hypothetical protein [Xanthomonadaceae bacterium]